LTPAQTARFVNGCEQSSEGGSINCTCVLDNFEALGYTTLSDLNSLANQVEDGTEPSSVALATQSCRT
jgi:hypothetical protein